jgi:endonuclease III
MAGRITRSMTASCREATALGGLNPEVSQAAAGPVKTTIPTGRTAITKRKRTKPASSQEKANPERLLKNTITKAKRKREVTVLQPDINELPHNLGSANQSTIRFSVTKIVATTKFSQEPDSVSKGITSSSVQDEELQSTVSNAHNNIMQGEKTRNGKGKSNPYGLTPGVSPFPQWCHPTPEECEEVNTLLSSQHGEVTPPPIVPEPSLTVTGCGEVPSVLDALIRTLLSGATTGGNSAMAFQGLVKRFGILQEGIGKGSVNWNSVRCAPIKDVYEAIKSGGLADMKSKYIKDILNVVHQKNMERKDTLLKPKEEDMSGPKGAENEPDMPDMVKQRDIDGPNESALSLDYIHTLETDQAMLELVKFPGIGPKTAACVILFCLQRPCFAVDTHIFRLCKWLGWIPLEKVNEITAFSHLETRIPDHLKYSLHQLFIRHGKTCPRCRAITGEKSDGWDQGCVIDHLVRRTGKRKGGAEKVSSKRPTKRPRKDGATEELGFSDNVKDDTTDEASDGNATT